MLLDVGEKEDDTFKEEEKRKGRILQRQSRPTFTLCINTLYVSRRGWLCVSVFHRPLKEQTNNTIIIYKKNTPPVRYLIDMAVGERTVCLCPKQPVMMSGWWLEVVLHRVIECEAFPSEVLMFMVYTNVCCTLFFL